MTCKYGDCTKPARGRGWCSTHWLRWRKYGDPSIVHRLGVDYRVAATCSVDGCGAKAKARELCAKHYARWRSHGDPLAISEQRGRPLAGDVPTWTTVHKRLTRAKGPARDLTCVDCSGPAAEWSYDLQDPDELASMVRGSMLRYSLDLSHYVPRCVRCHRVHDRAAATA